MTRDQKEMIKTCRLGLDNKKMNIELKSACKQELHKHSTSTRRTKEVPRQGDQDSGTR